MTTLTSLVVTVLAVVVVAVPAVAQPPVGALAIDERRGDQYGWAVDFETAAAAQGMALQECGSGLLGRADVRPVRGLRGRPGREQHGGGLGRIVQTRRPVPGRRRWRNAVPAAAARGVHRPGVGLQRPGGRRGTESEPGHAASDPIGPAVGRLRPRRGRRSLRSADAGGDPELAVVARDTVDRISGRPRRSRRCEAGACGNLRRRPAPLRRTPAGWKSCSGSRSRTARTRRTSRRIWGRFPNGVFSELAQNRLSALGAATPAADPASSARPDETCAGQAAGVACWMEISQKPGCYVWNPYPQPGETVTWTGACAGRKPQGTGTITWAHDGGVQTNTGRFVDGEKNGHWVVRFADGAVSEGPYVDGERHGYWVAASRTETSQ